MISGCRALAVGCLAIFAGCGSRPSDPVEDLEGGHAVSTFALRSLQGTRDGERLEVRAVYDDGSRSLTVSLRFNVTPPARLESGTWTGLGSEGHVRERAVTFLGGQSGPPSIGGRFDLVGPENRPLYRITIPVQELRHRL
jgi:hypothetical protein